MYLYIYILHYITLHYIILYYIILYYYYIYIYIYFFFKKKKKVPNPIKRFMTMPHYKNPTFDHGPSAFQAETQAWPSSKKASKPWLIWQAPGPHKSLLSRCPVRYRMILQFGNWLFTPLRVSIFTLLRVSIGSNSWILPLIAWCQFANASMARQIPATLLSHANGISFRPII